MEDYCKASPRPRSLREFFTSTFFWKPFLSIIAGALFGFLYFYFVGCKAGSCAITSDPFASMFTGALLGFLVTSSPCSKCQSPTMNNDNGIQRNK